MKKIPSLLIVTFFKNKFFSSDGAINFQNVTSLSQPSPCHSVFPQGFLSFKILIKFPLTSSISAELIYLTQNLPKCKRGQALSLQNSSQLLNHQSFRNNKVYLFWSFRLLSSTVFRSIIWYCLYKWFKMVHMLQP